MPLRISETMSEYAFAAAAGIDDERCVAGRDESAAHVIDHLARADALADATSEQMHDARVLAHRLRPGDEIRRAVPDDVRRAVFDRAIDVDDVPDHRTRLVQVSAGQPAESVVPEDEVVASAPTENAVVVDCFQRRRNLG